LGKSGEPEEKKRKGKGKRSKAFELGASRKSFTVKNYRGGNRRENTERERVLYWTLGRKSGVKVTTAIKGGVIGLGTEESLKKSMLVGSKGGEGGTEIKPNRISEGNMQEPQKRKKKGHLKKNLLNSKVVKRSPKGKYHRG